MRIHISEVTHAYLMKAGIYHMTKRGEIEAKVGPLSFLFPIGAFLFTSRWFGLLKITDHSFAYQFEFCASHHPDNFHYCIMGSFKTSR